MLAISQQYIVEYLEPLSNAYFPVVGNDEVLFLTSDRVLHRGKYDFNIQQARRWIDEDGRYYSSEHVLKWNYVEVVALSSRGQLHLDVVFNKERDKKDEQE